MHGITLREIESFDFRDANGGVDLARGLGAARTRPNAARALPAYADLRRS